MIPRRYYRIFVYCFLLTGSLLTHILLIHFLNSRKQDSLNTPNKQIFSETRNYQNLCRNFPCTDRISVEHKFVLHGNYWILYDFIPGTRTFRCDESVTYTAPADLNFLDNIIPLVDRWRGPVSISVYAPGTDFDITMNRIRYLRDCETPLIRKFVTFHIFFEVNHFPKKLFFLNWNSKHNCKVSESFRDVHYTYRRRHNLTFPIGLARNIARRGSQTHFFLNSDIEQYPNPGFISDFLEFVQKDGFNSSARKVYVIPHFEVTSAIGLSELPKTKSELQDLFRRELVFWFHKSICVVCHRPPRFIEWMNSTPTQGLNVFTVGKREGKNMAWEPFYVGTRLEPEFDERFTWESNKDKRIQGYIMCKLEYEYRILDNAFLLHRPGIKRRQNKSRKNVKENEDLFTRILIPNLRKIYGKRNVCSL